MLEGISAYAQGVRSGRGSGTNFYSIVRLHQRFQNKIYHLSRSNDKRLFGKMFDIASHQIGIFIFPRLPCIIAFSYIRDFGVDPVQSHL